MAKINSRSKGKRGEKKARLVLEKWTGMEFAGVPASGGLRWAKADHITGDIICTDPLHRFDFSIEVKNYRGINFEHLLMPQVKSVILHEFWPQCLEDSKRGLKIPILMMRYDGIKPGDFFFIAMSFSHFKRLKPVLCTEYPYLKIGSLVIMNSNILLNSDYKRVKHKTEKIIQNEYGNRSKKRV